jgi:diadenosine tetraphosphatase ApaH/serine/threonine PP2A family protein phosphatase
LTAISGSGQDGEIPMLALLADLHANLEGVTACLAHARQQGATSYAFLGDLIGYGADPSAVLDLVQAHVEEGAIVVRGNHDTAVFAGASEYMDPRAREAIDWTRARLSSDHLAFLAGLPLSVRRGGALFVHASAAAPDRWTYVTDPRAAEDSLNAADATWVFCGHVHEQVLYFTGASGRPLPFRPVPGTAIPVPAHRRWLAIVGSAGQPRDGNPAACYALADLEGARLTFHRVPYDWRGAAAKIRAAGLPERLARRLERGE